MAWLVSDKIGNPGGATNPWSADPTSVFVDSSGYLHLKIQLINYVLYSTEVRSMIPTRFGKHLFQTIYPLDSIPDCIVLGLFLYRDTVKLSEIDIEFTKTFGFGKDIGSFSVKNSNLVNPTNSFLTHFNFNMQKGTYSTHVMNWTSIFPNTVTLQFQSFPGHYEIPTVGVWKDTTITSSSLQYIPQASDSMYIMMNFWVNMCSAAPANSGLWDMVISGASFPYTPSVTMSVIAGSHGKVTASGPLTVPLLGDRTFTIVPDAGYHIDTVKIDGVIDNTAKNTGTISLANIDKSHTIQVAFAVTSSIKKPLFSISHLPRLAIITSKSFPVEISYSVPPDGINSKLELFTAKGQKLFSVPLSGNSSGRIRIGEILHCPLKTGRYLCRLNSMSGSSIERSFIIY
jgi:hypothetical protein